MSNNHNSDYFLSHFQIVLFPNIIYLTEKTNVQCEENLAALKAGFSWTVNKVSYRIVRQISLTKPNYGSTIQRLSGTFCFTMLFQFCTIPSLKLHLSTRSCSIIQSDTDTIRNYSRRVDSSTC